MKNKLLLATSCIALACLLPINAFASETTQELTLTTKEITRTVQDITETVEKNENQDAIATIKKDAKWYNPSGDNENVEYDAKGDIDIDGIVQVTVKVNIEDYYVDADTSTRANSIKVVDYFDSKNWSLLKTSLLKYEVSDGIISQKDNKIVWSIPEDYVSGQELTLVYYLQLKESAWNVTNTKNCYINTTASNSENKLLDESCAHVYYISQNKEYITNSNNPSVVVRQINWIPIVKRLSVNTSDGIYKNYNAKYSDTYYLNQNALDKPLQIIAESYIRRSYDNYKITENVFDIYQGSSNQVLAGTIKTNELESNACVDLTNNLLANDYNNKNIVSINGITNKFDVLTTGSDNTGYIDYSTAKLLTNADIKINNSDEEIISIYPVAITSNGYQTTRDLKQLENKRIDIIVDGEEPKLTPDNKIQTKSSTGQEWTKSDGYIDINLVDGKVNPEKMTHTLSFRINDEISGISSPDSIKTDWITTSSDNLQIKLERVDNDPKVIFNSTYDKDNLSDVINVQYNSTKGLNDTAIIQLVLNPDNEDVLGHLKLHITAYDNVMNKVEKTYDIYTFCLTAEVKSDSNLPKDGKNKDTVALENGERGIININAAGYADSISVLFDTKLEMLYAQEVAQKTSFNEPTILAGYYPNDDIINYGNPSDFTLKNSEGRYILPKNLQVATWGYTATTLGGIDVTEGFNRLNEEKALEEAQKEEVRTQLANEKASAIEEEAQRRFEEIYGTPDDWEEIDYENLTEEEIEEAEAEKAEADAQREAALKDITSDVTAEYEATEEPDPFDFVKNDILQENLDQLIYNFSNNASTQESGDDYFLNNVTLYTYPTFNNGKVNTYAHVYKLNYTNAKTINGKAYPSSIILDGNTSIEVTYTETDMGVVASVEDYTDVSTIDDQIQASWIDTGNGIKRPLAHYFYVPLNAPETYYHVQITEYKDSDTEFVHSVSINVTFSNTAYGSKSIKELQSYIMDN